MGVDAMTWAALLARWTEFAKSAVALPKEGEGGRLREAVPSIIALQAVHHALGEIDALPTDEYALAQDRGEVLIRTHAEALHALWRGEALHEGLREIIDDARTALARTRSAGHEWIAGPDGLLGEHPGEAAGALVAGGFTGDWYVPAPGVRLSAGCPAGFLRTRTGAPATPAHRAIAGEFLAGEYGAAGPRRVRAMRQVYRQWDFASGRVVRDYVVPLDGELPGGQPLLVGAVVGGEVRGVAMPLRGMDHDPPGLEFASEGEAEDGSE